MRSTAYAKSRHYNFGAGGAAGSGAYDGGQIDLRHAQAFRQHHTEALQQGSLRGIGLGDTAQANLTLGLRWQDDGRGVQSTLVVRSSRATSPDIRSPRAPTLVCQPADVRWWQIIPSRGARLLETASR
jgi:hypothetical protein